MRREQVYEDELEVNMTPMLDIVFIMLIFFIVTAVFVKESGVKVNSPVAETSESVKRVSTLIGVTENNEIWINKRKIKLQDVAVLVAKIKLENPKGKVVIKADRKSDSGFVVAIVEKLNAMGVAGVAIATQE